MIRISVFFWDDRIHTKNYSVEFSSCVKYIPNFKYLYRSVLEKSWLQELVCDYRKSRVTHRYQIFCIIIWVIYLPNLQSIYFTVLKKSCYRKFILEHSNRRSNWRIRTKRFVYPVQPKSSLHSNFSFSWSQCSETILLTKNCFGLNDW